MPTAWTRLAVDERLPSSRELAHRLGLSRGIVQQGYLQLQAEGYLTSRPGSATRVAAAAVVGPTTPTARAPARARPAIADFRHGVPDLRLAPREDWAWAVREICRTAPNSAFDYGDPAGEAPLRDVIAAYLRRVRAVSATAEQVVICNGMARALGIALRVLAANGVRTLAFEDPGAGNSTSGQATAAGVFTAGQSKHKVWNNADSDVCRRAHRRGVDDPDAFCRATVTRSWYVRQASGDREFHMIIEGDPSERCRIRVWHLRMVTLPVTESFDLGTFRAGRRRPC